MRAYFISLGLVCILLTSCNKYDIQPPEVVYMNINGQSDDLVLTAGTNYSFFYKVSDNKEVDRIDIRVKKGWQFESNVVSNSNDFSFTDGRSYDQKEKVEGIAFNVPANVNAGTYRLGLQPSDPNNNVSLERFLEFIVVNGNEANINVDIESTYDYRSPNIRARRGDRIWFKGDINSPSDLKSLKFCLYGRDGQIFNKEFKLDGSADLNVPIQAYSDSLAFVMNPSIVYGDYRFVLSAVNANDQVAVRTFKIHVPF